MSLAENLLNSLEVDNINVETPNEIKEPHVVVSKSRKIIVPNELKAIAVTGDKDVETITFDCIRFWDDNDLYQFAIYINYVLPNGGEFTYVPEKVWLDDVNSDIFHFDWVIKKEMTYYSGKLQVSILAIKTDADGMLEKQWGSFITNDFYIEKGLENLDVPNEEESKDVISQLTSIVQGKPYLSEIEMNIESFSSGGTFKMIVEPSYDGEIDCSYCIKDENDVEILKFSIKELSDFPLEQELTIAPFDTFGCYQEYEFNKGTPKFYLAENYGSVVSVTQEKGNSKFKVMSQEAVTEALEKLRYDFGIESWEKIEPTIENFSEGGTFKLEVEPDDDNNIHYWLGIYDSDGSLIAEIYVDKNDVETSEYAIVEIEPFDSTGCSINTDPIVGYPTFYKLVEVKPIIVQTLGDSQDKVISQKAITKYIGDIKKALDSIIAIQNELIGGAE